MFSAFEKIVWSVPWTERSAPLPERSLDLDRLVYMGADAAALETFAFPTLGAVALP